MALIAALSMLLVAWSGSAFAQATGKLNDSGIVTCADETSNSVPCSFHDNDTNGYPRQDAQMGRSPKEAQLGANAGGLEKQTIANSGSASPGFWFQKLAYDGGAVLATSAVQGTTTTTWGCTKDLITGLIWDMKVTTAANLRTNTSTYNWKDSNALNNGGTSGTTGTASGTTCTGSTCDTEAYITAINAVVAGTNGICGETLNNWRLPTRLELMSIVDASKQNSGSATVDSSFFPNIVAGNYWASDNLAGNPSSARLVNMATGADGTATKSSKNYVILVRPQ